MMLKAGDLVLQLELLSLQLCDLCIRGRRMVHGIGQLGLQGSVPGLQLIQMRLKTHAILH